MRMSRSKCCSRRFFTLMEVIVAMGVFTVIMAILLEFFAGAQKLWSGADGKNELYADARAAMDLMASTLQSQYYEAGSTVFLFGTEDGKTDALFFPVKMPEEYGSGEELYYLSFVWHPRDENYPENDGGLFMRTYGTKNGNGDQYRRFFEPNATYGTSGKASDLRKVHLGYDAAATNKSEVVITGVMSLHFTPVQAVANGGNLKVKVYSEKEKIKEDDVQDANYQEYSPYGVKISMQMLGKRDFETWKSLGGEMDAGGIKSGEPEAAKDFRLANTRQFDRIVYLGFK